VLAVLLLLISSFIKIYKTGKLRKLAGLDFLIILQGALVLFSTAFISSKTWLNWWDAGRFIIFNVFLYMGLFLLSVKRTEILTIIHWISYGVIVVSSSAIHNLIFGRISTWYISSFGDESYVNLGTLVGLGVLFFLHNILFLKKILTRKIISFILLGSLVFLMPFIPSRGILIALIFAFLFIFLKLSRKRRLILINILAVLLLLAYMGMHFAGSYGVNVKRFWSYTGAYAKGVSYRLNAMKSAIELFKENPILGIGMGEFMLLRGGKGTYPHNLFVESLVSFGVFAIFIFWPTFIISFKNSIVFLREKSAEKEKIIIALWFLFFFFESLVSGSLSNFRTLWLFMGILSILHASSKKLHPELKQQ
jgi:O-antigen ligase